MRTVAIIQARMGSTRLSGKVMKELCGITVLAHDIARVKQARLLDEVVVATTTSVSDEVIMEEATKHGVKTFRGSETDVLSRYYLAAKENNADVIVRITSDCPLFDPIVLDDMLRYYHENHYDIVSNAGAEVKTRTYPRGLDCEIFSFSALENAFLNATENYQREHVTPYIYENAKAIHYFMNTRDYSKYRWTLDTEEDWKLILNIYEYLYHGEHDFYLNNIIELMDKHPELHDINKSIEQKEYKA